MTSIEEMYTEYYKDIYVFVLSLSRDEHVAEEVAQDTFLKAMNAIDKFEGKCDIRVWLCQIAKNTYFTYTRKNKMTVSALDENKEEIDSGVNIAESLLDKETAMRIHQILHKMEEPYKEVFYLRVFGELSFAKIATIYGKTESWCRVTYHRARLMIMEQLGDN